MPKPAFFTLFLFLLWSTEASSVAAAALEKPRIVIDNGLLSVVLKRVPASEVFRVIAGKENLLIRLDGSLLKVLLTDEFERLPLEEGLIRLIGQLKTDNFLLGYVAEPGGGRRVVSAEILAKGSAGVVEEFGSQTFSSVNDRERPDKDDKTIPKGRRMQIERGLNPGQQRRAERTGKMPASVTRIPEGVRLRMERGEDLGGWQWKVDRALQAQATNGSSGPAEDTKGQSAGGSEAPEKK